MFKTITDEDLKAALQIVRPLHTRDGKLHWLALSDPRNEAFTWQENAIGYAKNLQEYRRVETWHTFGFYGFFKPSLAECLAHLTDNDLANGVCGVECRVIEHGHWAQTLVEHNGEQFHRGLTIFLQACR